MRENAPWSLKGNPKNKRTSCFYLGHLQGGAFWFHRVRELRAQTFVFRDARDVHSTENGGQRALCPPLFRATKPIASPEDPPKSNSKGLKEPKVLEAPYPTAVSKPHAQHHSSWAELVPTCFDIQNPSHGAHKGAISPAD